MRVAFFDIGTNSIHMKIVEFHDRRTFEVVEHFKDMTRIGDGGFEEKRLSNKAMRRALKVLKEYGRIAQAHKVRRMIAVATSAVRDAKNGDDFVRMVKRSAGISIRIISGEEEARLIYLGACSNMDPDNPKILLVDIGGGSAEFVLGDKNKIVGAISLKLGVARLRERFVPRQPPKKEHRARFESYIKNKVSLVRAFLAKNRFKSIVGTGGTMMALSSLAHAHSRMEIYRPRGYFCLTNSDVKRVVKQSLKCSLKELRSIAGMDNKRADLMYVGSSLVHQIMKGFDKKNVFVSDKGIREGLLLDYLLKRSRKTFRKPTAKVQWFGQKPYFSGRLV